jgi:hypothetical protein
MKRYLSVTGVALLVSCASLGTPITRNNSQITFPHYSIVVPPDRRWDLLRPNEMLEAAVVTKRVDLGRGDSATYLMQFSKNDVLDERPRSWSARQVADNFRNMEKQIMIEQGVSKGQYKLGDVVMGEESVGDKKFYTMKYTTSDSSADQTGSLYLYFPREEKNPYFIVIHYSETTPRGVTIRLPFYEDFLETLKSLHISE